MLTQAQNLLQVTTTAPTTDVEPISLEDAIVHLSADMSQSREVQRKLEAARDEAERYTRRTLRSSVTRQFDYKDWQRRYVLPYPPLQSVTSVQYYDTDNTLQTVTASGNYDVETSTDGHGSILFRDDYTLPTLNDDRFGARVIITAVTGYGSVSAVPAAVRSAIELILWDLWEDDGSLSSPIRGRVVRANSILDHFTVHEV
jgi:hypothetical protein